MEKKMSRSCNFNAREENILLNLANTYKDKVESKKSDTNNNKIKADACIQICKEFNGISREVYRTHQVLKNKYENIKKRAKQKFADNKNYMKGTGGGPSKEIVMTTTDTQIHEILGTQLTGLCSQFDNDAAAGL